MFGWNLFFFYFQLLPSVLSLLSRSTSSVSGNCCSSPFTALDTNPWLSQIIFLTRKALSLWEIIAGLAIFSLQLYEQRQIPFSLYGLNKNSISSVHQTKSVSIEIDSLVWMGLQVQHRGFPKQNELCARKCKKPSDTTMHFVNEMTKSICMSSTKWQGHLHFVPKITKPFVFHPQKCLDRTFWCVQKWKGTFDFLHWNNNCTFNLSTNYKWLCHFVDMKIYILCHRTPNSLCCTWHQLVSGGFFFFCVPTFIATQFYKCSCSSIAGKQEKYFDVIWHQNIATIW